MNHADGDLPGLWVALPLQVVVDPRLQVASQLGLREPCSAKVSERVRKAAALRAAAIILLGKLGRKEENFAARMGRDLGLRSICRIGKGVAKKMER